jgi:hypothetical protein
MSPIRRGQRIFFAVICAAALLVAVLGLFKPDYLASIFTWVELPPLHARFVGAIYAFGAVFMLMCLLARYQAEVRWGVQMIGVWTGALLVISLMNLRAFDFTRLPVWIWFASYTIYPIISLWMTIRQPQMMQAGELPGSALSGWAKGYLQIQGILFAILAGMLFASPVLMTRLWPWDVSPRLAQMYAGPLLSYGLGSSWFSRQEKWLGIRALVPAMLVFTTTTVLISFMHINLFSFSQTSDVIWFGWFILATLVHAVMTIRAFQEKSAASA